jgi:hypothetical protein
VIRSLDIRSAMRKEASPVDLEKLERPIEAESAIAKGS